MNDLQALLLSQATQRLREKDLAGADQSLRDLLAAEPDHAMAWHLRGIIAGHEGRTEDCTHHLAHAMSLGDPRQRVASGIALAEIQRRAGRLDDAETTLCRIISEAPTLAEPRLRLGLLLREANRRSDALAALRASIAVEPGTAAAHAALADLLYSMGNLDEAGNNAVEAVRLAPADHGVVHNLAVIRNAQGRHEEAASLCRQALTQGDQPELLNTLANACKETGRIDEAAAYLERAHALTPDSIEIAYNLATLRKDQGRSEDAVALFGDIVEREPEFVPARMALCMANLPLFYSDQSEIDRRRQAYATELGRLSSFAERYGFAAIAPGIGAAQPFLLAAQGRNDIELQREYGEIVCRAAAAAFSPLALTTPPRPGERMRIGVVSGLIRDHSVWRLPTRGWIEMIDRARFELIAYHTAALRDAETERAEGLFDHFVQGPLPIERWRAHIERDQPHVLLYPEIGMDPVAAQLAAMRLAPAQYVSWGHPSTSGYPTIDYFLSSAAMEPADGDAHYRERLVRLPGLSTPVIVEPFTGTVPSRNSLGLPDQATIYWCGQSLHKYLPACDNLLPEIARHFPEARFIFVEAPGGPQLTDRFRARLAASFASQGMDADQACIFLPRLTAADYRAAMGCADVVLDSVDWSGCNTLIDALSHALPIVTLPGETMRSAHGAAIMRAIGLDHLVARDRGDYVRIAVMLGAATDNRSEVQAALAGRGGRLEGEAPVRTLEAHFIASAAGGGLPFA